MKLRKSMVLLAGFVYLVWMYPLKRNVAPRPGVVVPPDSTSRVTTKKRIAVAFLVTKEGPLLLDAAAVLATQVSRGLISSAHQVELVGMMAPNVSKGFRSMLLKVGVDKLFDASFPAPNFASYSEVKRRWIVEVGCCGMDEMLKLWAYTLEQYEWVLSVDLDVLFLQSHAELFSRGARVQLQYVHEIAPVDHPAPCQGLRHTFQGGFIGMRPNASVYHHMVDVFDRTEFHGLPLGWAKSTIGACWGGATVQGFLSYYSWAHMPARNTLQLDHCVYDRKQSKTNCTMDELSLVKSVHFTGEPKPWQCGIPTPTPLQQAFHRQWAKLLKTSATRLQVDPSSVGCVSADTYVSLASKLAHTV